MKPFRSFLLLVLTSSLLFAGCPRIPADGTTDGSSSGNTSTSGTSTTGGTTTSTTGADALTARYPGCLAVSNADEWTAEVLRLVNLWRQSYGYDPVVWNDTLAAQADEYACEMIYYDFFDHVNPVTGSHLADRADEFHYDFVWIGENLAAGQRTPEEVVQAWIDSPCHKQNLLHPAFTELGVAVRFGGQYGYYWVQEFGRPISDGAYTGPDFTVPGCNE